MTTSFEAIATAVRDGNQCETADLVREAIAEGASATSILSQGLIAGMQALGQLFKDGQAFLPEILVSARAMNKGLDELGPHLTTGGVAERGTVILGTVEGDLHDIGKNLVGMLLSGNGFTVVDLGVDVSAAAFVAAARDHDADVVALSALLTTTTPQLRKVIEALDEAALRGGVAVMVGGASVNRGLADEIGADGFADDCVSAVDEASRLIVEKGLS
jgi:5-methyltetrahydrofolate--homocysteine methyltransferase